MNKMIAFVTHWYPTVQDPVRGVFVRELARAVSRENVVTVIAFAGWSEAINKRYKLEYSLEEGIPTVRFTIRKTKVPGVGVLAYCYCVVKSFRILRNRGYISDLIHAHVYSSAFPALLTARLHHTPIVVSEHSTVFIRNGLSIKERIKARLVFRAVNAVLPVSEFLRNKLEEQNLGKRLWVVPNVVDESRFRCAERLVKSTEEPKQILVVGLLHDGKGYSVLFRAIETLLQSRTDFMVNIVGHGPKRAQYEQTVRERRLEKHIVFRGALDRSDVARLMMDCDFFVLPSLFETFGVVFIEAIACGKPVIASDIGGPQEIIDSTNGILVEPGNSEQLAHAIERMLDEYVKYDPGLISQAATEKYGRAAVTKRLGAIYDMVLSGFCR